MSFNIKPASQLEDDVFQRIIDNIPPGQFYQRAKYVQPRWDGTTTVNFVIEGTQGNMVSIYLGDGYAEGLLTRVGMENDTAYVKLPLLPPPQVNYVRAVDGTYNVATDTWTANGDEIVISVVVTKYVSVLWGVTKDWFKHVWLPYLKQNWSLTGEWGCRLVEWYFKYHKRFPDTQALRTLAVRLASRATWNELTTTQGVEDMVAALCCSEPVVMEVSNQRPYNDFALWPTFPVTSDFGGFEFNVWFPDIPTVKELGVLKLCRSLDFLTLEEFVEPHIFIEQQSDHVVLTKDETHENMEYLLRQIGVMDGWKGLLVKHVVNDRVVRFWDNALDNLVAYPGLGSGDTYDSTPPGVTTFDQGTLDSSDEHFTGMWNELGVNVADGLPDVLWDSVIQRVKTHAQTPPDNPPLWQWEWTTLSLDCSTTLEVSNPLHGGAPAGYVEP